MANDSANPEILAQAEDELRYHESVRRILRENGVPTNTSQFNFRSFTAEEVSKKNTIMGSKNRKRRTLTLRFN